MERGEGGGEGRGGENEEREGDRGGEKEEREGRERDGKMLDLNHQNAEKITKISLLGKFM